MSDYKKYFLRSMGMSESQIKPSIDPDELEQGSEEDGISNDALKIGGDDVKEPFKGMGRDFALSPTAIATPVIGVSVRGSVTGGLPSGADQIGDISPGCMGGYEKIPISNVNSKVVDKTPSNSQINSSNPINRNPKTTDTVTHPHQVQNDVGEAPQAVTGASTDSDDTLTLKSAMPKGMDIDIAEGEDEDNNSNNPEFQEKDRDQFRKDRSSSPEGEDVRKHLGMNETFARHKQLMDNKLSLNESTCKCGDKGCKCKCKITDECKDCGCDKLNTSHDMKENVGASEPLVTNWKMDKEKGGMVKVSEAFERMRGLANLGERRVMSNGLWNGNITEEKWIQNATKDSTKGALHKDLGVPEDKKIPTEKLKSIKSMLHKKSKSGTLTPKELKLSRRVNAALNMRGEG